MEANFNECLPVTLRLLLVMALSVTCGCGEREKDTGEPECVAATAVAYDGIAIVVNPANDWAQTITVAELETIWAPASKGVVMKWRDVRAEWPDRPLTLFGPGVDSGTYDYFTEAVVGEEHSSRGDFTSSEDDNVLVQGVAGDSNALGFFGFAYYAENRDKLRLVPVDDGMPENGDGPVAPSLETIRNGTYQPLSRPLFIYVSSKSLDRPEVLEFATYFLQEGEEKLARQIFDDMRDERPDRLRSIRAELLAIDSKDFWEIVDRGENFDYLVPERKDKLHVFFGWFPKETME